MRNQASRAVFDYWINIKRDRPAPLRTEIDPAALRHLLPYLFIAANDADGVPSFRLAGTRICDLFAREFRGAAFAEMWLTSDYRRSVEIVHNVIHDEVPAHIEVDAVNGKYRHPHEMLLLPMKSSEHERSDRVLGALLPQTDRYPETELPVKGLALDNWTFLTGDVSHFGMPVIADQRGLGERLRRIFPDRRI
ncbi:PAS domain-containing protein [Rhizobium sp. XQZ8]|uniref:PAS domain-containing protein n=1 Tax=Rhizobium populisoli TaxID=2859785 RepID=UPI001CA4AA9F|nr:PAS domain-containing protein [Rhizobium populisoli]MBW6424743.1 PAS domain-containing protein [Rhizobium populisoli]